MKALHWLALIVFAAILSGCDAGESGLRIKADPQANPWTHLKLNNDPGNFQFVIVADRTGGRRAGVFVDAVRKINLLQPEFVICIGDLISDQNPDRAAHEWDQFDELVKKLQMPFFYVPGNNDIGNEAMLKIWQQRLGRLYYHFIYHDVLFLCLDTVGELVTEGGSKEIKRGHMTHEQMEYFRRILRENPKVRWTLLFTHIPVWEDGVVADNHSWLEFEKILAGRNYTVFAGHKHKYAINIRQGQRYITLATTGGARKSTLDGPAMSFDHVVWVTVSDQGPRVANLMLDGILDENLTP